MREPLENIESLKKGYVFAEKTWYSDHHLGVDYICQTGTPVFAPENGVAAQRYGAQGGNTVELVGSFTHRFMHLSRYGKGGNVNAGDVIGYVGNTGNTTTGPHLHWDARRNGSSWEFFKNYTDPEKLIEEENQKEEGRRMEIEAGITLEAVNNGVILRTVPTEADGQWSQTAQLSRGDRCEVLGQTPDHQWVNVNAAGVKQGWARITDFKVVYRRDLIDNPAETSKEEFKRLAIIAIESL